eukprot:TRINITY_DN776061_c0_g1_i1.p1 TRINITY_DN776061_c0_g1~~TRINITY_DN776061_c0_g1_i1.p1  ORF type:complete len:310 (-),score=53.03 TRINITY_DN776061_c0_g1_i1:883-1812(-)
MRASSLICVKIGLILSVFCFVNAVYIKTPSDLPKITPNTTWEVYYLESPLFEAKYNTTLEHVNGFHSGIGFRNIKNRTEEHLFQYLADGPDYVLSAFYPVFKGTKMDWQNGGFVDYRNYLAKNYWTRQVFLGKIKSSDLEIYKKYALDFALKFSHYKFFEVVDRLPIAEAQIFIKSQICHDYSFASMKFLSQFHVADDWEMCAVRPLLDPRRDFIVYITGDNPVKKVNMEDPIAYGRVLAFFVSIKNLTEKFKTAGLTDYASAIKAIINVTHGTVFVYDNTDDSYYEVKTVSPHLKMAYDHSPEFQRCG